MRKKYCRLEIHIVNHRQLCCCHCGQVHHEDAEPEIRKLDLNNAASQNSEFECKASDNVIDVKQEPLEKGKVAAPRKDAGWNRALDCDWFGKR
jgi:hypothetical protein